MCKETLAPLGHSPTGVAMDTICSQSAGSVFDPRIVKLPVAFLNVCTSLVCLASQCVSPVCEPRVLSLPSPASQTTGRYMCTSLVSVAGSFLFGLIFYEEITLAASALCDVSHSVWSLSSPAGHVQATAPTGPGLGGTGEGRHASSAPAALGAHCFQNLLSALLPLLHSECSLQLHMELGGGGGGGERWRRGAGGRTGVQSTASFF